MEIDPTKMLRPAEYVRIAVQQAQLGVLCRFLAPNNSWEVRPESLGGKVTGVTFICRNTHLLKSTAAELKTAYEIAEVFHLFLEPGTHFTIKLDQ